MINTFNTIKRDVYDKIQVDTMKEKYIHLNDTMYEKDKYTFGHCKRVAYYSSLIGKELGLSRKEMESLIIGAFLHDFGKITIPRGILNKKERLSDNEWKSIQFHPMAGTRVLQAAGCSEDIISIVLSHHERYDGKGYPQGLKGEEIPLLARIVSVADAYDAMSTSRCYSGILEDEEVLRELLFNKGTQFDPDIADVFIGIKQTARLILQAV